MTSQSAGKPVETVPVEAQVSHQREFLSQGIGIFSVDSKRILPAREIEVSEDGLTGGRQRIHITVMQYLAVPVEEIPYPESKTVRVIRYVLVHDIEKA